ncbi:MAG: hypothetical protein ACI934_001435, partial [Pseudohongiellaceae bacterium]
NILQSTSEGTTDLFIGGAVNNAGNFADFEGSIQGAFVDNEYFNEGTADDVAFVTSFFFKDTSDGTDFSDNFITGVGLIGGSAEKRFDAFAESDMTRLGLVIPAWESSPAVYGALATTEPNTPVFADNSTSVASNPFTLPAYENIGYVFLNQGAVADSFQIIGDNYDVNLGVWKPAISGDVVNLTSNLDSFEQINYNNDVYWSNVSGGGALTNPGETTFGAFASVGTTFLGESSEGAIKGVKTFFDLNAAGSVIGGTLSICAGGSNPSGCSEESTNYKIIFSGTTINGVFNGSVTSATVEPPFSAPQALPTITGELEGLFTGIVTESTQELYDAFVGGFNFGDSGDSTKFLAGTFVVEREDRLTAGEIGALTQTAILVNNESGNTGFFRTNSNTDYLVGGGNVIRFDEFTNEIAKITDSTYLATLGHWEEALVMPDNLIYGNPSTVPEYNQTSPVWWVSAKPVLPPKNLSGTYRRSGGSTPLPFLGYHGNDTDPTIAQITQLDIEFSVDFSKSTNNITNGSFYASADNFPDNYIWDISGFGGETQDGALVFDFTNATGTYEDENANIVAIDQVSMRGIFINSTATTPNFKGEGVAGGFSLASGNNFLDGVFVAGIEDVAFLDLRLEGLDPLEIDESNPINNGLVMIGDWQGWNSDYEPVYEGIVAFDAGAPVFLTDWNIGAPGTVFKQDNATGGNTFPLSSTYPGVQWGIWDMQAGEIGPSVYFDLAAESFGSFDFLPWLVVPALDPSTEITTYTGLVNYGFTRASMTRNSWGGTLSALNVSMGLDFSTGYINDGTINLCFGGSGCASSEESWHGHFGGGSINQGVINPIWVYGSVSNGWDFEGEIGGFMTGYNAPPNNSPNLPPYDALVGGFSLAEGNCGDGCSSYTGRTVSGTFLSEQENRLDANDMYYVDGHKKGALMQGDGTIKYGLIGTHDASLPTDIFFIDESTVNNTIWKLGGFYEPANINASNKSRNCGYTCNFETGIWEGDTSLFADNTSSSASSIISGPIAWLNYTPIDFSGLPLARFGSSSINANQEFNSPDDVSVAAIEPGPLGAFEFDFDVNLLDGTIHNTILTTQYSETVLGTALDFFWSLELTPDNKMQDGVAFFDLGDIGNITGGTLTVKEAGNVVATVAITESIISGAFTVSPDSATNDASVGGSILLGASFNFMSKTINTRVIGDYDVLGYFEERLSRNELLAMNDNLGLIVKRSGATSTVEEHFLTTGNNSSIRFADTSLTDAQLTSNTDGNIHDTLFGSNPLNVIEENGGPTAASNNTPGFNVGWGLWDGGADIIDAQGGSTVFTADPAYWLSVQRADIADLTGLWSYSNVIDHAGSGSHGNLDSLDMGFNVDFGSGQISNGFFDADVNSTLWHTEFTGTAHGPVVNIINFTGSTITGLTAPTITGEMRGMFTGTGINQGFATGFSLHEVGGEYLNGVGLLGTRTALPLP